MLLDGIPLPLPARAAPRRLLPHRQSTVPSRSLELPLPFLVRTMKLLPRPAALVRPEATTRSCFRGVSERPPKICSLSMYFSVCITDVSLQNREATSVVSSMVPNERPPKQGVFEDFRLLFSTWCCLVRDCTGFALLLYCCDANTLLGPPRVRLQLQVDTCPNAPGRSYKEPSPPLLLRRQRVRDLAGEHMTQANLFPPREDLPPSGPC